MSKTPTIAGFLIVQLIIACRSNQHRVQKVQNRTLKKTITYKNERKINHPKVNHNKERDTVFSSNKFYSNLSDRFNFRLKIYEHGEFCYNGELKLAVFSKKDSLLQTIRSRAGSCAYPFTDPETAHVRSFETHYNEKRKLSDGYYHGELIAGDFNFDSLTDIALINAYPMSGTPSYTFYMQTPKGTFEENTFYTNKVQFMPVDRNYAKRTFLTKSHTGCCTRYFDYFKVDSLGKCSKTYSSILKSN